MIGKSLLRCVVLAGAALCLAAAACSYGVGGEEPKAAGGDKMTVEKTPFGKMPDGRPIDLYTMTGPKGMRAKVITYGATVIGVEVPDRTGKVADVTLGYDKVEGWIKNNGSFGATVGRYANRIAKGKFTLDGQTYTLATNNGENHLHGGIEGFHKKLWTAEPVQADDAVGVRLTYLSKDGEEGYPGNLTATATYSLTRAGELKAEFTATTDKPTVVNLINHFYWNLGGPGTIDCLGHVLTLNADEYTVPGPGNIPTGEIRPVKGTPLDFTKPTTIGAHIAETDGGYDHNLVIRGKPGEVRLAAKAVEPEERPHDGSLHRPAGRPVLLDEFRGRVRRRQGRPGVCQARRILPGDAAVPRLAEPRQLSVGGPAPGQTYRHTMICRFSTE